MIHFYLFEMIYIKEEHKMLVSNKEISFKKVSNEWLHIKKLSIKNSTYEKYENIILTHLDKNFGNLKINQINEELVFSYFQERIQNNDYSTSTLKGIRYVLKAILDYAQSKYHITHVNFSFIKLGKSNNGYKQLTIEQKEILESYCFNHLDNKSLMILLSLYGGFRVGEVAGLKWEDIDFETGIISVNRTIERLKNNQNNSTKTQLMELEPKTVTSKRLVPIPGFMMNYLKSYYQQMNPDKKSYYIYTNSEKISDPRNIQYHFEKICQLYGFKINFHSLRHTYATNCVMSDIDIKSLSEILGHSSVSITLDIYVHSTLEFKRTQIKKIKAPDFIVEHDVLL